MLAAEAHRQPVDDTTRRQADDRSTAEHCGTALQHCSALWYSTVVQHCGTALWYSTAAIDHIKPVASTASIAPGPIAVLPASNTCQHHQNILAIPARPTA
jgi:hypothetical protein